MAIAVIRVKSVALIVEDPPEGVFWVGSDLIEYDESGMARRRAISVIISIADIEPTTQKYKWRESNTRNLFGRQR